MAVSVNCVSFNRDFEGGPRRPHKNKDPNTWHIVYSLYGIYGREPRAFLGPQKCIIQLIQSMKIHNVVYDIWYMVYSRWYKNRRILETRISGILFVVGLRTSMQDPYIYVVLAPLFVGLPF